MTYGHFDANGILIGVFSEEDESLGLVALPNWEGFQPGMRLRLGQDGQTSWEPALSLEEQKVQKIAQLRSARDQEIEGGFSWDGSTFDSDSTSQQRLLGAMAAAQAGMLPNGVAWRLFNNDWRLLAVADIAAAYQALTAHTQEAFSKFALLEAEVVAASSAAEVESVSW